MGKQWKQWETLFLGCRITAYGDWSHEIKICLLLGRKVMTNLDSILNQRHHFAKKVLCSQSYDLSSTHIQMWELDHKQGECWRIDSFELWCWRRHLRVPWTARRPSQSIPKEVNPEYSLKILMLKLKLRYFGHLMWRTNSMYKILIMEKTEGGEWAGDREWDGWMASMTQ